MEGHAVPNAMIALETAGNCGVNASALPAGFCMASSYSLQITAEGEYVFKGPPVSVAGKAVDGAVTLKSGLHHIELQTGPGSSFRL